MTRQYSKTEIEYVKGRESHVGTCHQIKHNLHEFFPIISVGKKQTSDQWQGFGCKSSQKSPLKNLCLKSLVDCGAPKRIWEKTNLFP